MEPAAMYEHRRVFHAASFAALVARQPWFGQEATGCAQVRLSG
jgi:hypothetical protein